MGLSLASHVLAKVEISFREALREIGMGPFIYP